MGMGIHIRVDAQRDGRAFAEATGDGMLRAIAQRHIDNRFDVLGSGWVEAARRAR